MTQPIFDPTFWEGRLEVAIDREKIHHTIYACSDALWDAIRECHRGVLSRTLKENTSILDIGCGWGRLLSLMPPWWKGTYLGVDIVPRFIEVARRTHPEHPFLALDARRGAELRAAVATHCGGEKFDLAVLVSIREMVKREAGGAEWEALEKNLRGVAEKILYLEYDPTHEGSLE